MLTSNKVTVSLLHRMSAALHCPRCLSVVCAMVHVCLDLPNVDVAHVRPGSDACLMFDVWVPGCSRKGPHVTAISYVFLDLDVRSVLGLCHWSQCSLSLVPCLLPVAGGVSHHVASRCHLCETNPICRKSVKREKSYRSHG